MKMALSKGIVYIKDFTPNENSKIKSWGLMKYSSKLKMYVGPASHELLKHIAQIRPLSPEAEKFYREQEKTQRAVDYVRTMKNPPMMVKAPVKKKLYEHQVRAFDMALITFGVIDPDEVLKGGDK